MKRIFILPCIILTTIMMLLPKAYSAMISLVPQSPKVFVGEEIGIDVMLESADPIFRGALDFTYPSGLVNYAGFEMNRIQVDGSLSFFPNSSTPGILNDFIFAIRSDSEPTAVRLATMIFNAGSSTGTADFDVFLEPISIGPAWVWGQTGDEREYQPISSVDLANFTLNGTSIETQAAPIPTTLLLFGAGLTILLIIRRRQS